MVNSTRPIIVGISGASGAVLAQRTVAELLQREVPTIVVCSNGGKLVWQDELGCSFNETLAEWREDPHFTSYQVNDLRASIASGTFATGGMVVVPCTIKTLSGIANSYNENLLVRAADVTLKEGRKLVLVVRETPLHKGHLRLMTMAADMGAHILPPVPSFYHKPKTLEDIIDQTIGKVFTITIIQNTPINPILIVMGKVLPSRA